MIIAAVIGIVYPINASRNNESTNQPSTGLASSIQSIPAIVAVIKEKDQNPMVVFEEGNCLSGLGII